MAITYEVPLSYTINVSLSAQPQGIADFNTNSIAIFSNDPAGFSESYRAYFTPDAVATDFGSDSLTYKMARALFAPVPNFRSGEGNLYIFPFSGTNATSGSFATVDISANLPSFQSVQNGSLNIVIDGVDYLIDGLNFTSVKSVADIAQVIRNKNLNVSITADETSILFESKSAGENSGVSITAVGASGAVDISTSSYLDAENGIITTGENATGETLAEAVTKAMQQVYFGGVITTQVVDNDSMLENARAVQALDCVYYNDLKSLVDITGIGADIKAAGLGKTRTLAYSKDDNKLAIAAYASVASSINFNGSNTMNTMNLKTLAGIVGDDGLSDTYVLNAKENGVDIYGNTGGLSVVYSNDNNGYTDDIKGQLWLKKAIEVAGFNFLRQTNTKIPQTEEGMAGLKNAYLQVCEQGIRNGFIAPGAWSGLVPFGDGEKFRAAIEQKGYYIYSIPVAKQSQTEREARKAPVVQIAIKCAGALHFSDVVVVVQR